jgi:hypothetical protein
MWMYREIEQHKCGDDVPSTKRIYSPPDMESSCDCLESRTADNGWACSWRVDCIANEAILATFWNAENQGAKTIKLALVLYGCETWFFTVWEGPNLWIYENKVLGKRIK